MMYIPCAENDDKTEVFHKCSNLKSVPFEPVGRWFEGCLKRQRSEKSASIIEEVVDQQDDLDCFEEKELSADDKAFLLSLDASEWKKQDHYRVLGLEKLRFDATEEDIKKAYRRKVLRHHPDKKKDNVSLLPPEVNEHEYFTCITRAYEVLSSVEDRQAYDSVDEEFPDEIPSYSPKQDFFEVFSKYVKLNARWSSHQPVPLLGDMNTSIEDVNAFYTFWYDFHSWRNFSNLDTEDTSKAESREERRWMEAENKKMRQKRKKEEIARIRKLVDVLFQNDPRLKKYKQELKLKKLEEKKAKEKIEQEKEMQRKLALEEEKKSKDKAELEAKEKVLKEKKEKEKLRKSAAKDRKTIKQAIKNESYFNIDEDEVKGMERLEIAMENLSLPDLQELRELVEKGDKAHFKDVYFKRSTEVLEKIQIEKEEKRRKEEVAMATSNKVASADNFSDNMWNEIEKQLLVKATTLFPVGTSSRWEVIAEYINEHSGSTKPKTSKQVIHKVKNLRKLDPSHKDEVNKLAFQNLEKSTNAKLTSSITAEPSKSDSLLSPAVEEIPWSSDEQKLLEQALKTYGANTPERWEKIASVIPSRTKKDCMKRYKELVEMVKAKKAVQAASSKN
ncbi:dnaJ homolog subfamily C member 2 isoform X2 [Hydra vulgaris]|uniref:DnaJ homolog subfamily C member 2 n=1 Tax=Hydra vulgaris TaxID=6087 RepID=A0ABM4DIV9_HYDVU